MKVYRERDLRTNRLVDATTAIIGYGNQGHAHALNLRDSGARVVVGARQGGGGWSRAAADGFEVFEIGDAVAAADFVAMLLPDESQGAAFDEHIRPRLKAGATVVFAHGYAITFDEVALPPGHDVVLVAPKGQGHFLRKLYVDGHGLMCLIAAEQDASGHALESALSYAEMLGCLRSGAIATTFREETITDLFGEQAVLCGGVPGLIKAAFETLVERGYSAEVAYLECLHELKIIADLMYSGGIEHMRERISRTAAWGSYTAEETLIDDAMRTELRARLDTIESGEFARRWQAETKQGQKKLTNHFDNEKEHPIADAGIRVRGYMPYLKEDEL